MTTEGFALSDYDFEYPESRVASEPAEPRDSARLLLLDRHTGVRQHARFSDLPRYLRPGDCLVVNRTRVWRARLRAVKPTGGKVDLLLVREVRPGSWGVLSTNLKPGVRVEGDGWKAEVIGPCGDGELECRFEPADVRTVMARAGLAPLPPYIVKRRAGRVEPGDAARYQTVYAKEEGSIAAPTAGLHFTPGLLDKLRAAGVSVAEIVLHVGRGTFKPISAEDIRGHKMLPESYWVSPEAAALIDETRTRGGRVVAVGTTATRALESRAASGKDEDSTGLFITPEHRWKAVDALVTNFHLPRSTPLVLASSFAGREKLLEAYHDAVSRGYRLYSYGDAMLIQ